MVKKQDEEGVYAIYWKVEDRGYSTRPVSIDAPNNIKRMIASHLLEELGIPILITSPLNEKDQG